MAGWGAGIVHNYPSGASLVRSESRPLFFMSKKQNPKPTTNKVTAAVTRKASNREHVQNVRHGFEDIKRENEKLISPAAQAYWDYLSDPFSNKQARPVFYDGCYTGNTGLVPGRAKGVVTIGTAGVGFIMFTLDRGPTSKAADCPVSFTGGVYAGTSATAYNTAAAEVYGAAMTDVPYDSTESRTELIWRPVGGAMRITPRGSLTNQDGIMTMIEIPGHMSQYGTTTYDSESFDTLLQHPRTRVIRAAQLGDPSVVNQLNWHPQSSESAQVQNSGYAQNVVNDVKFRPFNSANTTRQFGDCIIGFQGTSQLTFEFEFVGLWETKGSKASGLRPSIQDAHASAIIFNTLCRQKMSGLVGKPHEFHDAYHVALHHSAKKTVAHVKNWVDIGRDIAGIVKEVAGFLL